MKHKPNLLALAAPAGLVLPEQLAQAADAVRELLAEAAAANTTRSYAAARAIGRSALGALRRRAAPTGLVDPIQCKNKTGLISGCRQTRRAAERARLYPISFAFLRLTQPTVRA